MKLLNLHFLNICRHHPTLKFKPHATDDERYVSGIDGVPLIGYVFGHSCKFKEYGIYLLFIYSRLYASQEGKNTD